MRIDLVLPSESATDDTRALAELAGTAEHHGFGALWLPDHLLPPNGDNTTYGGVHEPLVTLAFLAAHTTRLLLGTSVLIAPLREPVLLAKQTATPHALAPGRILLGLGTGWERAEFDAVGAEYEARGHRTDQILKTVRELRTTDRGPGGGVFAPTPSFPSSSAAPPARHRAVPPASATFGKPSVAPRNSSAATGSGCAVSHTGTFRRAHAQPGPPIATSPTS